MTLKFTDGALTAVVQEALKRKTGARGLRAILEESMLDIMYEMPSQENLKEVIITEECINSGAEPISVYLTPEEIKSREKEAAEQKPTMNVSDGGQEEERERTGSDHKN